MLNFLPQVAETNLPQPADVTRVGILYDLNGPHGSIKLNYSGDRRMKKIFNFVILGVLLVTLSACKAGTTGSTVKLDKADSELQFTTPGPNPEMNKPVDKGVVAGLGTGLWHGLISVVTLIISFFNPDIQMYEVHNTGPLYNLGFLLGAILLFVILGYTGGSRRR